MKEYKGFEKERGFSFKREGWRLIYYGQVEFKLTNPEYKFPLVFNTNSFI